MRVCRGRWDADGGDEAVIISEARWRKRQPCSFLRLSERASLSSASLSATVDGPLDFSHTDDLTRLLQSNQHSGWGGYSICRDNSPSGQITNKENYLFLIFKLGFYVIQADCAIKRHYEKQITYSKSSAWHAHLICKIFIYICLIHTILNVPGGCSGQKVWFLSVQFFKPRRKESTE